MSYRDPGQIQAPRTGQIFGQAIASFGQQVLSFAQTYAAQRERAAKEQEEENNRIQQIGYSIEEKAYENANKNYIDIQAKSPSLAEQFKTKTAELLNGVDGKIGAIEAQTELSTRTDLTKERRNELRNIVENAKAFQNRMIAAGGEITADLQGMENIRPQDIGNTHFYVGDTLQERLTSQFSAATLNNKEIPGALTNKILKSDKNGMPIISVSTVFDAESAAGKKLLKDFPELKSNVKNGKISFNWERSVNQLGEGFIKEIPAGVDATQAFEDSGAMKDGRLTQQMMVGQPVSKRFKSGAEGRDNLVTTQYINTAGLEQDVTFNAQVEAKMDALISQDPGDIRAYMQNTLMLGSKYDYSSFMQQPAAKKKELLTKLEKERVIGLKLKGFSSRIATKEDAEYINNNAKALAADGKIAPVIPGETKIYFTEKVSQISSIKPSATREIAGLSKTAINSFSRFNEANRIAALPPMSPKQIADELTSAAAGEKSFITGQEYVRRALADQENVTQEVIEETAKDQGIKLDFVYDAKDNTKFIDPADTKAYKRNLYNLFDLNTNTVRELETFISSQDFSQYKEN